MINAVSVITPRGSEDNNHKISLKNIRGFKPDRSVDFGDGKSGLIVRQ